MDKIKKDFIKKHGFHFGLIFICLAQFIFLISLAGIKSLWYDDIYQLFFSWNRSLEEAFEMVLKVDLNPPLWPFVSFLWLKIAPYGTVWLKLPSIIFTVAAGYIFGLSLKEVFNKRVGLLGTLIFALSPYNALECAYTFRAYGLFLFASSLIIYAYIKKTKNPSVKNRILFGISVFILAFTHYFGALLCVFLGAFDLILAIKKKQKFHFFIEYAIVAILELAWLIPQISTISVALSNFWPPNPTVFSGFGLLWSFLHNSIVSMVIFCILLLIFIAMLVMRMKKRGFSVIFSPSLYFRLVFLLTPLLMIAAIIVYCNINTKSSLWVYRYFLCLYPMIMFFFVSTLFFAIKAICLKIKGKIGSICKIGVICVLIGLLTVNYSIHIVKDTFTVYEPFEQSAETIMSGQEIKDGEYVIVYSTANCGKGWRYYLSKNNSVDTSNISLMDNTDYVDNKSGLFYDMSRCKTVYIYAEHLFSDEDRYRLQEIRQHLQTTHTETVIDQGVDEGNSLKWAIYKYKINK